MSALRRRIGKVLSETPSPSQSREGTPDAGEEVRLVPVSKLKSLTTKEKSKRKTSAIFALGSFVGILVALFFAGKNDVIKFEGLLDMNLESLMDVIPAGIVRDAREITVKTQSYLLDEALTSLTEGGT